MSIGVDPVRDDARDFEIVLFQHHHMAVAVNAPVCQADEIVPDARLRQILRRTMIIRGMIRRFGGKDRDRNIAQIGELMRGLFLAPAFYKVRRLRFRLRLELQLCGVAHPIISQRHCGEAPRLRQRAIGKPVRRAFEYHIMRRRSGRLDRHDRLHQIGPRVGNRPAKRARLRMGEQNGRPDAIQQCSARIAVQFLLLRETRDRRQLFSVELIEHRIACDAGTGPLRVQPRLRPQFRSFRRGELLFDPARRPLNGFAIFRAQRGAPASGLIHHINRITLTQKKLRPAVASIGRAGEIGSALTSAFDHHDRQRMRAASGYLIFDPGLT